MGEEEGVRGVKGVKVVVIAKARSSSRTAVSDA